MSAVAPIGLREVVRELLHTKTGVAGIAMLLPIILMAVIAPLIAPYDVVKQWTNPVYWQDNPRDAMPVWVNWILGKKYPPTIRLNLSPTRNTGTYAVYTATVKFDYDDYPSELRLYIETSTLPREGRLWVEVIITRPDNLKFAIYRGYVRLAPTGHGTYEAVIYVSTSPEVKMELASQLANILGFRPVDVAPEVALFSKKCRSMYYEGCGVLRGQYSIEVKIRPPVDAKIVFVLFGKVHGLFGTDDQRRDIALGILWGAPIALAFGLVASLWSVFVQALLGSLGAWYSRRLDEVIQRLADIMLILPLLPILILINFLYKLTIWNLLLVIMLFSVVGVVTKTVRPLTLQIISEQYIEAAVSYGASKMRILVKYILPRQLPYLVALVVMNVPQFIFLEAALCMLGLGDPELPTWGRILSDAWHAGAAYHGYWWWILTPAGFIAWTAIGFALLGYALDKIVNPRLREM